MGGPMLEGLDSAPLIESGGFMPEAIAAPAPEAGAATLDAALREAARAERAAERADATMLDLWLHRPGGANLSVLERPTSAPARTGMPLPRCPGTAACSTSAAARTSRSSQP